jgi:hypothetical protein
MNAFWCLGNILGLWTFLVYEKFLLATYIVDKNYVNNF